MSELEKQYEDLLAKYRVALDLVMQRNREIEQLREIIKRHAGDEYLPARHNQEGSDR